VPWEYFLIAVERFRSAVESSLKCLKRDRDTFKGCGDLLELNALFASHYKGCRIVLGPFCSSSYAPPEPGLVHHVSIGKGAHLAIHGEKDELLDITAACPSRLIKPIEISLDFSVTARRTQQNKCSY
jgi:hypothetical protein